MTPNDLPPPLWAEYFGARRSQIYHERRCGFFTRLHRLTNFTAILLAGVIFFEIAGAESPWFVKSLAVLGAVLSAADLVIGFSRKAEEHFACRKRFIDLEGEILHGAAVDAIKRMRREIERGETPAYRALDILCHNALCASMAIEDHRTLPFYQRFTAHIFEWPDAGSAAKPAQKGP